MDFINDARRGQVKDASTAVDCGDNGVIIEEINLVKTETRVCSFK
jgi:hypothetical protein